MSSVESTEVVSDNVPDSLGYIRPILRIASEIDHERPRVAFLCRSYALEKAHGLDPLGKGRGVTLFKESLLQLLTRDNESSLAARVKETDALEIDSLYRQYYDQYISLLDQGDNTDRAQHGKAYQTAGVLFEVLCSANRKVIAAVRDVEEWNEILCTTQHSFPGPELASASMC